MTVPVGTIVLLHGHDDDPADTTDLARALAPAGWDISVPAGPVATGATRRAWWRSDDDGAPVSDDVAASVAAVDDLIRSRSAAGPVILGGFSQGGALALALGVRGNPPAEIATPAGVFAVGAWLPDLVALPADIGAVARHRLPFLIGHGEDDDDVPVMLGRGAARLLDRHGIAVTYVPLGVGHVLAPFADAVAGWITAVAAGELPTSPP